jgi:hypothetical protein
VLGCRREVVLTARSNLEPLRRARHDSVAVFDDHSCAVRAGGDTECWGNNDDDPCNVPQDAASQGY